MSKGLQAKHVSSDSFLAAIRQDIAGRAAESGVDQKWVCASVWNVAAILGIPDKVVRAKVRALVRQRLITGCACGCRGDLQIREPDDTPLT